jgi:hypothetical protein
LIALVFAIAGCGGVDWFPAYKRLPTTPDSFSFTPKTGVALTTQVISNSITVSGLTGDSSPIRITGSTGSNSKYSINDAAAANATDAEGTVKNGDTVTVTHTSASTIGSLTSSTLSIGIINGTFTSLTQTVQTPVFSPNPAARVLGFLRVFALLTSVDSIPGNHVISINGGSAEYALGDVNGPTNSFSSSQSPIIPALNGLYIFLRVPLSTTSVTTTLTIDNADFPVAITP